MHVILLQKDFAKKLKLKLDLKIQLVKVTAGCPLTKCSDQVFPWQIAFFICYVGNTEAKLS